MSLTISVQIEDAEAVALWKRVGGVVERFGIDSSASFLVTTDPYVALQVFRNTKNSGGKVFLKVFHHPSFFSYTIESVLIGSNPSVSVLADESACYTGSSQRITRSKLIAHVVEPGVLSWVHINTLLQQT